MFSIEQNGRDWVVLQDGVTVSVHPIRQEAERAAEWLVQNLAPIPRHQGLVAELTPRELVVLRRLNRHGSYADIAHDLYVSTNTIKSHVKSIYSKLGVADRGSAIAAATVLGLLDRPNERSGGTDDARDEHPRITADDAENYFSEFQSALRSGDWSAYATLHRPDARQTSPVMTCEGIEAIIESNQRIVAAIPDVRFEARHITVDRDGNRAIYDCVQSGTLAGPLSTPYGTIPATGQPFHFASIHVVTFDDSGLASEIRRYWDLHEVLRLQGLAEL